MTRKPLAPASLGTSGTRVSRPVPAATAAAAARTLPCPSGPGTARSRVSRRPHMTVGTRS